MTDKFIDIKKCAEYFSVSDDTIRNWAKNRGFPLKRVGGVYRALYSDLRKWADSQDKDHKKKNVGKSK
ncbi:helix-turn-helix transcriptional regulator [Fibrobacterota bacterium]